MSNQQLPGNTPQNPPLPPTAEPQPPAPAFHPYVQHRPSPADTPAAPEAVAPPDVVQEELPAQPATGDAGTEQSDPAALAPPPPAAAPPNAAQEQPPAQPGTDDAGTEPSDPAALAPPPTAAAPPDAAQEQPPAQPGMDAPAAKASNAASLASSPPPAMPPDGTFYSQRNTPPPPAPPSPPKGRRVGTITMALCLIATGVVLLVYLFVPDVDLVSIARFAPVVLVLLGIEILVANVRHRNEKLRYDALSVLVCLLLIGGSLVAAVVPNLFQQAIAENRVSQRLAAELENETWALMDEQEIEVFSVQWNVELYGDVQEDMTLADLSATDRVTVWITLSADYKDAEAFAKGCRQVLDQLAKGVTPAITEAYLDNILEEQDGNRNTTFEVWLQGTHDMKLPAAEIAQRVSVSSWENDVLSMEDDPDDADSTDDSQSDSRSTGSMSDSSAA